MAFLEPLPTVYHRAGDAAGRFGAPIPRSIGPLMPAALLPSGPRDVVLRQPLELLISHPAGLEALVDWWSQAGPVPLVPFHRPSADYWMSRHRKIDLPTSFLPETISNTPKSYQSSGTSWPYLSITCPAWCFHSAIKRFI
jgi:hypothetical protein